MPQFVPIPERQGIDRAAFDSWIAESSRPIVMPGLVADWHMVGAARESPEALAREIRALEKQMLEFARNLEFEKAAQARDQLGELRKRAFGVAQTDHEPFTG